MLLRCFSSSLLPLANITTSISVYFLASFFLLEEAPLETADLWLVNWPGVGFSGTPSPCSRLHQRTLTDFRSVVWKISDQGAWPWVVTRHVLLRLCAASRNMSASETTTKVAKPFCNSKLHANDTNICFTTCKHISIHSKSTPPE